jgi:RNA polymerase sigma factor for flagellar operon FliA
MVACVGPTGCGKTTTLAKLAARAHLEREREVAVITLDTFRVGAVEQMRRFVDLMGVPLHVANDRAQFAAAMNQCRGADVVLVDTASRAPSDRVAMGMLAECLATAEGRTVDVLLTIPAMIRARDVDRLHSVYETCPPTGLIVTKLDETDQIGGTVHAAVRGKVPLVHLCRGPRVPEDLEDATVDAVPEVAPIDPKGAHVYERYMPIVRRIAMRMVRRLPREVQLDDLLGAGWVGLAEALRRCSPDMPEHEVEAYASHRIRGAILDYLRSLDPMSRKMRNASRQITTAMRELSARLGRSPEEQEIADELGVSLEVYQELLAQVSAAEVTQLELVDVASTRTDMFQAPDVLASQREIVDRISDAVDALPERLRMVVGLYYQDECSLKEIGAVLGVTESRACQLHSEAMHRMRAHIESAKPKSAEGP